MATVTNNFNTGLAAGTAITTANSDDNGAGVAFDSVGGTGTKTFETRDSGLYGLFTSVGSGQSYAEYTTSVGTVAPGSPVYGSADLMVPVLPGAGLGGSRVALILNSSDGFIAEWRVTETGTLEQRTAAGGVAGTTASTITAGQWFKIYIDVLNVSGTTGQLRTRLFLDPDSNSPTETITSTANLNLGSGTSASKYRFGVCRTFTDFATGVDNVRWSTTSQLPVEAGVLIGPVAGNLTDDGFTVAYRTSDAAGLNHRLVVDTDPSLGVAPVYSSVQVPDADGFVKLSITGLTADTLYYYGLEVDSLLLATGRGQIQTDTTPGVPADFSVAFGSCQYDSPTTVTFEKIRALAGPYGQVRRFIHMGDLNYRDWNSGHTAADMRAQHQTSLASAAMRDLLAEVAMTYAWDNHDWGGSFSDKSLSVGATVAAVYRQVFPHYTLPATDGKGIWHSWVQGRVRFIQIDPRSQRDAYNATNGPSKTMLGVEQKAWFKNELLQPEPVKIICGNMFWREGSLNNDRWGSYPDEFDELNDFIDANSVGNVYLIFGDRHALCADDGSSQTPGQSTRGIPQAGGAPFQQGSTGIAETWSQGYYDTPGETMEAFGVLHITDNGSTIVIDYEGITSEDDTVRISMQTVFQVDQQITATGVASGEAFGVPTVTPGQVSVTATSIPTGEAFGLPAVSTGPVTVTPAGIGSTAAFGTATVSQLTILRPTGIPTGLVFGTPAVTTGPVTVTATGIGSTAAVGTPEVQPGPVTLAPTGIGSSVDFGLPELGNPAQYLTATGVPSATGFGLATITAPQYLTVTSIAPVAAVGGPYAYTGPVTLEPAGIGSVLDFGTPAVTTGPVTVQASGVASGVAWGRPSVQAPPSSQTINASPVASGLAFGLPGTIMGSVTMRATSVVPVAAVGSPSATTGPVVLTATGVASEEAFGDTHIIGGNSGQVAHATSIGSGEAFGLPLTFVGKGGNDCECAVLVGS